MIAFAVNALFRFKGVTLGLSELAKNVEPPFLLFRWFTAEAKAEFAISTSSLINFTRILNFASMLLFSNSAAALSQRDCKGNGGLFQGCRVGRLRSDSDSRNLYNADSDSRL